MTKRNSTLTTAALAAALAVTLPGSALAADGDLDSSFSRDGRMTTGVGGYEQGNDVAVQPDGRVVVAGTTDAEGGDRDFLITRYTVEGALDTSFGGTGKVITGFGGDDFAQAVAIQDDGKIVVAGETDEDGDSDFAVARYNPNGTLDDEFSDDGKRWFGFGGTFSSEDRASDLAIQEDGKIVVVGTEEDGNPYDPDDHVDDDFAIARLNPGDGSHDRSFSFDGEQETGLGGQDSGRAVAIQEDGKIVVAGTKLTDDFEKGDIALARYTSTGELDSSLDGDGKLSTSIGTTDSAQSLAIQQDGKLVVGGSSDGYAAVMRLNLSGTRDSTFTPDGVVRTSFFDGKDANAAGVALQDDGRIVMAGGSAGYFVLARYDRDGRLDMSFAGNGKLATDFSGRDYASAVAIQDDGKIVAAGTGNKTGDFALARYIGNAAPETQITSGPAMGAFITDTTPTFAFRSPDRYARFDCALRPEGPYYSCNSPYTPPVLSDGPHYFLVRAVDTSGKRDPGSAYRLFTVDTVPPETQIDDVNVNAAARRATIEFSGVDPDPGSVPLSFKCRIDGGEARPCNSPTVYEDLDAGEHAVRVRAIDKAGNEDETAAKARFTI